MECVLGSQKSVLSRFFGGSALTSEYVDSGVLPFSATSHLVADQSRV